MFAVSSEEARKWMRAGGYLLLAWGVLDVALKLSLFGWSRPEFLWFCTVTMFVLGVGMVRESPMLLNTFLSMAIVVQLPWTLDYVWQAWGGESLTGLASFVFQPGFTLPEFINNTRHLIMLPLGLFAVAMISRPTRRSYIFIALATALVMAASYIFPLPGMAGPLDGHNINCVREPCVPFPEGFPPFWFFAIFTAAVIGLSLSANLLLDLALRRLAKARKSPRFNGRIALLALSLLLFSLVTIAAASVKYAAVPKYSCVATGDAASESLGFSCRDIFGEKEGQTLVYSFEGSTEKEYQCDIFAAVGDAAERVVRERLWVKAGEGAADTYVLPYPREDTAVVLRTECESFFIA